MIDRLALAAPPALERLQRQALVVGVVALAACAAGLAADPAQFFRSYLLAFVFWTGIAVGCLAIVMVHHLTGGAWGLVIRRPLESATRTLPLVALFFLPIAFGLPHLYLWARPDEVARDAALQLKAPYLNVPFFLARSAFYFAAWIGVASLLNRWSREQDRTPLGPAAERRFRLASAPGLLLYGLTATFASVDWLMSLDPHWFSTMFGVLFMGGQGLSALAFATAVLALLSARAPLAGLVAPRHFHDLGKLLLAFVMLWAYFSISQYLIVWSGNLPEEIPWYLHRLRGGWEWIGLLLIVGHFALPFMLLLSRRTKRQAGRLAAVALAVVVMRLVDLFWVIAPEFHHEAWPVHWLDLMAPIGLGGLWLAAFAAQLRARPLLPVNDPFLEEALANERH